MHEKMNKCRQQVALANYIFQAIRFSLDLQYWIDGNSNGLTSMWKVVMWMIMGSFHGFCGVIFQWYLFFVNSLNINHWVIYLFYGKFNKNDISVNEYGVIYILVFIKLTARNDVQ